jgi:N-methylhydantoinase A/oxoprolinase/acetone carboxylase beta subunit
MNSFQKFKLKYINFYPPLWFAGIRVKSKREQGLLSFTTMLKSTVFNRGIKGTYFGGSSFNMVDPFHMLILMDSLGDNYIVWDRESTIRFLKPSKKKLYAHISISEAEIEDIKFRVERNVDDSPKFTLQIHDQDQTLVAQVDKTLYVRKISA